MNGTQKVGRLGQLTLNKGQDFTQEEYDTFIKLLSRVKIKIDNTQTLEAGQVLFLNTPRSEMQGLVKNGIITADEATTRLNKIPDFVICNVNPSKKDVQKAG